jgi:hypothetical protein
MFEKPFLEPLQIIHARLQDCNAVWAITGSLSMALQGLDLPVHDIDLQTDTSGAYEMERLFSEYLRESVHFWQSPRIRSHFGRLEILGVQVEIMGDIAKSLDGVEWEAPTDVVANRCWVDWQDLHLPVITLEHEYHAYLFMGRLEKAELLKKWLDAHKE